jgi:hypothetical protein
MQTNTQFLTISCSFLLRMRSVSEKKKNCRGNQNTFYFQQRIFFFENRAVYEIMWKNVVEPGRSQKRIWHMRTAC